MTLLLLILFFGLSFSQGKVDGLVAIVGNNIVLHSDVLQQTHVLASSRGVDPSKRPYLFERLYVETLENIVNQFVVLDVAEKDTNLIVSDEEVDRALRLRINEFIEQAGSEEAFEEIIGSSLRHIKSEYWQEIHNMMLIERYKFSKIKNVDVSRVEVNIFYDSYKDSIAPVPEKFTFSVIEVPFLSGVSSETRIYNFLDSLRSLLVAGASFDSLAVLYSQDPGSAAAGGRLGFIGRGALDRDYEEAAFSLFPGEISLPVRSAFGYHLIRLIERLGEKISTQHILLTIPFSDIDRAVALEKIQLLYKKSNNDPFVFDSLSIDHFNVYNNFSGTFVGVSPSIIPTVLLQHLSTLLLYTISSPIETEHGYAIIYLYKYEKAYSPNTENAWTLIHQFSLQEKQGRVFGTYVDKIKLRTFIKYFYN